MRRWNKLSKIGKLKAKKSKVKDTSKNSKLFGFEF
jgi:hypothetical protein